MAISDDDLAQLATRTGAIYQRQAARYDAERARQLVERAWLERFTALLPDGGAVLDLGCGGGEPIARYLIDAGLRVTGVDLAPAMIELARARCPAGDWRVADLRTLALPERFHGIIGWDSFFHLTAAEQRATLPRLAAHLRPRGALLLTVGHQAGEVIGHVGGEPVFHASLAPAAYRAALAALDLDVVAFTLADPTCAGHSVLLAQARR
ncbi:MAG: class I SAM-dependent methyltransferase [Kofleriaceae bacterium]